MILHIPASGHMCADSEAQIWRFTVTSVTVAVLGYLKLSSDITGVTEESHK